MRRYLCRSLFVTLYAIFVLAMAENGDAQKLRPHAHVSPRVQGITVNEWTWMGGSSVLAALDAAPTGIYGDKGVFAAGNVPGGRNDAVSWTDPSGNFWLFGGQGGDSAGTFGDLNDLWEYVPALGQWAWVSGSNIQGQSGTYGVQGTAAAANVPGNRTGAVTWTDPKGNLWLFGGRGAGAGSVVGDLNDLWMFNPSSGQWTWESGSSTAASVKGVYGTLGSSAATNLPGSRYQAAGWADLYGNLWLFGGSGYDGNGSYTTLNDLWEFTPSTGQWTWMGGSNTGGKAGVYGTLGTPAAGNIPGCREASATWVDFSGNFWLFGGGEYNDLWMYNPNTGEWTWVSGSSASGAGGTYGTLGTAAGGNTPGWRDWTNRWIDSAGNLWLFAGTGIDSKGNMGWLDDLWEFNPTMGEWAWMGGGNTLKCTTSCPGAPGVYGTLGVAASTNQPGGRNSSVSWTDSSGNLWLMGGIVYDANDVSGDLNDLWVYGLPSASTTPTSVTPTVTVSPSTSNITTAQSLTMQVTVGGGSGDPTPTGTISLSSVINLITNAYVSPTMTLSGGSATIDIPAGALPTGPSTLVAVYTPDSASSAEYVATSGTANALVTEAYVPSGAQGFGTVTIGQTSAPVTLTFTFAGSGTLGGIAALTQGSAGLDFAVASGGTCKTGMSFTSSTSCTVKATFSPRYAGLRSGALVLEDSSSNTVASTELNGTGSGPQVRILPGTPSTIGGGFSYPFGLAVDGSGDVFVADSTNNAVKDVPAGCISASCVTTVGSGFNYPNGVAMDVYGNLVVADTGNELVKEVLAAGGYTTINVLGAPFQPSGVAVDTSDNVFVAANDTGDEILASSGYATFNALGGGAQSTPPGPYDVALSIAVDASGNVFTGDSSLDLSNGALSEIPAGCNDPSCIRILSTDNYFYSGAVVDGNGNVIAADAGGNSILEFLAAKNFSTIETLDSTGLSDPSGIAVDGAGNVYVAQAGKVEKLDLADGALVNFPTPTSAGTTDSTDGTRLMTVENTGSTVLSLSGFTQPGPNFTIDSSKTTCTASSTLAAGASCVIGVVFNPTIAGTVMGTMVLTDDTLNKAASTQTVTLTGNGIPPAGESVPTVTVSTSAQVITLSEALKVTATVSGGSGNPTPTGSIRLTSGSYNSSAVTLAGGSGTINVPAGSLATGVDTLTVTYTADSSSSSIYTNASGSGPVTVTAGQASADEWTWIGGSDTINGAIGAARPARGGSGRLEPQVSGTTPGARQEAVSWTDSSGNFWLFGGADLGNGGYPPVLNDLWKYQPSANTWTMVGGSSSGNQPGVYGTKGTSAAGNIPGGRENSSTWTDSRGKLWLFGGEGADSAGTLGYLNDLWEFDTTTSEWTWVGGNSTIPSAGSGHAGIYGTQGTAAAGNLPGSRWAASSWVDGSGNLWLFGGAGYDANGVNGTLNDLWEYSTSSGEWTWIAGSSTVVVQYGAQPGVYGTLGTAAKGNVPGGRFGASSWRDQSGHLWLLGGNGADANGVSGELNDVWEFNSTTSEWTWMGGSSTVPSQDTGRPGVYGVLGTPASGNIPGGREYASTWTDPTGNLWLFGGWGFDGTGHNGDLNDLWEFNPSTDEWAWIEGSNAVPQAQGEPGIYGVMGTPSPANTPGGRQSASSWTDSSGRFWLFGGGGYDSVGNDGYLNDLWEYAVPSNNTPAAATPTFSVAAGTYTSTQSVTISDTTSGATIYYTTNGNTPTTSSAVFSGGTPVVVSATETLKAIATASGYSTSAVASATYTITPALITPTVTVSPSSSSITTAQVLAVTVTVKGGSDAATPTGSVTLTSGTYTSAAATLSGGGAAINIPAGALAVGTDTLTASYTPASGSSSTYSSATGTNTVTVTGAMVQVTVGTSPAGLSFSVDGTSYTSTQTLNWTVGASHTIATTSPQTSAGTQNTFASWSDGGGLSHLVTASSSVTSYTATFTTSYQLTTTASPSADGTVTPASGSYYVPGTVVNLTAKGNAGYAFQNWTGSVASSSNASTTITMSAPETVTANFTTAAAPVAALTPGSLTFAAVSGTTSASQMATLANSGNATLNITSIAVGGTNASDFAVTTGSNACGSTLAAGASCSIYVTFSPGSAASFSASLQVTDNAAGSPQAVSLTGTGSAAPTFTISSTGAQTVVTGGTATYTITVAAQNGDFANAVALSVSGLPSGWTASFSPTSVTPGSTSARSTLSIQTGTTATTASRSGSAWPLATSAMALISMLLLPGKRRRRWITTALLLLTSLGALAGLTACGGGFSLTRASQTYTLTVTGTSGTNVDSTNVELTVE